MSVGQDLTYQSLHREGLLIEPTIDRRVAVTVVGGYLGAGKTTLVNHVLRTADERVAVLVNDFGDMNIDEALIESEDGNTISLANGCICCSLVDGFAAALETVQGLDPAPQRLVIEASGVADPAQVAAYAHGPGLRLDAVVVIVDAETVQRRSQDRYVGDTVLAQIRSADILVLNKVDLVDRPAASEAAAWLRSQSPDAVIVDVACAEVDPVLLFGVIRSGATPPTGGPARASADEVFRSWSWSSDGSVARVAVEQLMEQLPDTVVRAKGVLRLDDADRSMILQRVGARWSLRSLPRPAGTSATSPTSQLVLIGLPGAITDSWLDERLAPRSSAT